MLKEKALYFYNQGYNCSQCILKAAENVYKIPISKQALKLCTVVSTGFGVGSMCSVLVAGVMVLGLLFDEASAKSLRIRLLDEFQKKHSNINCSFLKKGNCTKIVGDASEILEEIIASEKNKKN